MDVQTLTAHLEKQKTLLTSCLGGSPPAKHVKNGTLVEYREYLRREIKRTELKIEFVAAQPVRIVKAK